MFLQAPTGSGGRRHDDAGKRASASLDTGHGMARGQETEGVTAAAWADLY